MGADSGYPLCVVGLGGYGGPLASGVGHDMAASAAAGLQCMVVARGLFGGWAFGCSVAALWFDFVGLGACRVGRRHGGRRVHHAAVGVISACCLLSARVDVG